MTEKEVHIAIPARWVIGFGVAGAMLGVGAAFILGPVVNWLVGLVGDAPGPLRLAAALPMQWAIPLLVAAGMSLGVWMGRQWQKDIGTVVLSAQGMTIQRDGADRYVAREQVAGVFIDSADLVLSDQATHELLRTPIEQMLAPRLRAEFARLGYPWQGATNPHENQFVTWVDGAGSLDSQTHGLLRVRQRALADKQYGAADDARDELRDLGITIRDRNRRQQYRVVTHG